MVYDLNLWKAPQKQKAVWSVVIGNWGGNKKREIVKRCIKLMRIGHPIQLNEKWSP